MAKGGRCEGRTHTFPSARPKENMSAHARRVVVSYPEELGDWSRDQVTSERFKTYLKRVRGEAREGTVWEEFVDTGCCGDSPDIPLRVERVEGGSALGPDTEIEFTTREGRVRSGWEVQSRSGPPKRS